MEVLVPINVTHLAKELVKEQEAFVEKLKIQLSELLPKGYAIRSLNDTLTVNRGDPESYEFFSNSLIYKGGVSGVSLHFGSTITAQDVYLLSPLLQYIVEVDTSFLGKTTIKSNKV